MKPLFTTGIIILCLLGFVQVQSQSIILTFSGIKDGQPVTLDRIEIENLDKGCDTTLYYPVTELTLQPLGVSDSRFEPQGFTVFQNVPNPANGSTTVNIYQPETGQVTVVVTDISGRQVASYNGKLLRGYNRFEFTPGNATSYLFSARNAGAMQSIMIVSGLTGGTTFSMLRYVGLIQGMDTLKSVGSKGGFTFALGDHLRYTGYFSTFTSEIEDTPQNTTNYTFDFSTTGNPCPGIPTITDPRDGQVYPTVQIGNQCWLQKNMNYETGDSWCYNGNPSNCAVYGRLYRWDAFMQGASSSSTVPSGVQGVCPPGWHVPSDAEWTILTDYLGGESIAGGKMKETGTTHWYSPNYGATNSSGFTALPGGFRHFNNYCYNLSSFAFFWTSTEGSSTLAWHRGLYYTSNGVYRNEDHVKTHGFSARCIQD